MKLIGISGALRKASTNTGLLRALKSLLPDGVGHGDRDAAWHSAVRRGCDG
jgi:hypothetical protein